MSYFYLKPVEGNISLHTLQDCVYQRWLYFHRAINNEKDMFCEFMIEGSAYDNTGHFMLTLLSILSGNANLINAVINGEENLFLKRLQTAKANDLRLLCKSILKSAKEMGTEINKDLHLQILVALCRKLILKHIAEHISSDSHSCDCQIYNIEAHFTLCLPLVAKRQVELNKGMAVIPCCKWKYFLKLLFRSHLQSRCNIKPNIQSDIDPRWRDIISKLSQDIPQKSDFKKGLLKHTDIDRESEYFPLCMKNLHKTLRTKHRLSHNERFRYSLFLKDIGLPVQEAIRFWQHEYSKPSCKQTVCNHTWTQDGKKYIYGIRHLYGLEGSQKNYCMVNCKKIQSSSSAEGGCPFKHFDIESIKTLTDFNVITEDTWNKILEKRRLNQSIESCTLYKNAMVSSIHEESMTNPVTSTTVLSQSPIEYYNELMIFSKLNMKE